MHICIVHLIRTGTGIHLANMGNTLHICTVHLIRTGTRIHQSSGPAHLPVPARQVHSNQWAQHVFSYSLCTMCLRHCSRVIPCEHCLNITKFGYLKCVVCIFNFLSIQRIEESGNLNKEVSRLEKKTKVFKGTVNVT